MIKQSSEKKQKRPKTVLTIVEGDERTYIHPFSYYDFDFEYLNKILLLETPEFEVDQIWHRTDLMKREASGTIFTLVRRFWRTLKRCGCRRLLDFKTEWGNIRPVVGVNIYRDSTISVDGTLTPSIAGSKWTDDPYLIPSEEWIKLKLREWLFLPRKEGTESYIIETVRCNFGGPDIQRKVFCHDKIRQSYLTWAKTQVSCGRKIGFFTSLDT